jgi:hypothetical protein
MRFLRGRVSRQVAAAGAMLAAGVALTVTVPSRGQQPAPGTPTPPGQGAPTVQLTLPAATVQARQADANVSFVIPSGVRLARNPRLRVVDAKNRLWELLPTYLSQLSPVGSGFRSLHSENYTPGTYRVRAEIDYVLADGQQGTAVSPEVILNVAP